MSPWGWTPSRNDGIWRHGVPGLRPLVAAAPWLTLILLLLLFWILGGTLTRTKGTLFDLPAEGLSEGEATDLVALVLPVAHETLVFFDDARYLLDDAASEAKLSEQLAARVRLAERKTLLVLADRRVTGGHLLKFAAIARRSGVARVLFAEKQEEAKE